MKIKIILLYLLILSINSLFNNSYSQFSLTSLSCNPNPIPRNNYITVTAIVHNNGSSDYYDFEADLDFTDGSYGTVINKQCSKYIASGADATIQFTSNNPLIMHPCNIEFTFWLIEVIVVVVGHVPVNAQT